MRKVNFVVPVAEEELDKILCSEQMSCDFYLKAYFLKHKFCLCSGVTSRHSQSMSKVKVFNLLKVVIGPCNLQVFLRLESRGESERFV